MVQYLGVVLCTAPVPHVRMPEKKVVKLKDVLHRILQRQAGGHRHLLGESGAAAAEIVATPQGVQIRGRVLARVLGLLQFFRAAVPLVAVFTRALYECMRALPQDTRTGWLDYSASMVLSAEALAECAFWHKNVEHWNGFVVQPRTISMVLYTDGSPSTTAARDTTFCCRTNIMNTADLIC
jgi:hypothetical protein